jgi:hypothetical protein
MLIRLSSLLFSLKVTETDLAEAISNSPHLIEKRKQTSSRWTPSPNGLLRPQSAAACVSLSNYQQCQRAGIQAGRSPVFPPRTALASRPVCKERGVY